MGNIDYTKDLEGKTFGYLKVLHVDNERSKNGRRKWMCKCSACGKIVSIPSQKLISGDSKSCGCMHRDKARQNIKKYMGIVDGTNASRMESDKLSSANTSGVKGVSFNKNYGKYYAYIGFKNKLYSLGFYDKTEDAKAAREKAEKEIFGPFLEWYAENYPKQREKMQKKKNIPRS